MSTTTFSPSTPDIWSPQVYGERYVEERTRPGLELIQRAVHAASLPHARPVRSIVDLGCGTGRFIPALLSAFPDASVVGLDSSSNMLQKAKPWVAAELAKAGTAELTSRVSYVRANIAEYRSAAEGPVDLIFTNAALQWLPNHPALLAHLFAQLPPGGQFACQIPNDFHAASHLTMHSLAHSYAERGLIPADTLTRLSRTAAHAGAGGLQAYYDVLRPLSSHIDVWDTTYYQTISCPLDDHPVAHFLSGSSLNQCLSELPEPVRAQFRADYVAEVTKAYPPWVAPGRGDQDETWCCFPFSRYFMVVVKQ